MAQTIDFVKETKGISITIDGKKVSYSAGVRFMGYPTGTRIAHIKIAEFGSIPLAQIKVDVDVDTITVNTVAFVPATDDATDLIDSLRTGVFIADV